MNSSIFRTAKSHPVSHRVVVTGCGAISAIGNSMAQMTQSLRLGRSGVRLVASDPSSAPTAAACPLLDITHEELSASERALFDPVTRYAMHAAGEALEQSGLLNEAALRNRTAVFIGTAVGGAHAMEEAHRDIWYHGAPPKPLSVLCAMNSASAAHLAIRFSLRGPNVTYATACASSAIAIGDAFHAIRDGRIACALVGGAEACVTPVVVRAWRSMRILASVDVRAPGTACKPFSLNRSGIVLGEGAAMMVLEPMESALARGASILCELIGFGANCDATHICIPSAEGEAAAMALALEDAQLEPVDIDYLNASSSGTRVGDHTETRAIRSCFGAHADRIPASSTKAAHGHLLGASGAIELAVSLAALQGCFLPPTINLSDPDPECNLDYVANQARLDVDISTVMSSSFSFGGSNAVLIARRFER